MIRRPPRSTLDRSSAASDVYKRQELNGAGNIGFLAFDEVFGSQDETRRVEILEAFHTCLLYTSPSPRDRTRTRMPSSA